MWLAQTDSLVSAHLTVNKRIKPDYGNMGMGDEHVCAAVLIASAGQRRAREQGLSDPPWSWQQSGGGKPAPEVMRAPCLGSS